MLQYNEILKQIKKEGAKVDALKAQIAAIKIETKFDTHAEYIAHKEERETALLQVAKLAEKENDTKIKIQYLRNNARVALFHEFAPVALDILRKYDCKPHGEKTADKIRKEFNGATGAYLYVRENELTITPAKGGYSDRIEITGNGTIGNPFKFLIENRINAPENVDGLRIAYHSNEYIENIPARVKAVKKAYRKAHEAQEELRRLCSEYDKIAVDGLPDIYYTKNIYSDLTIN